MDAGKELVGQGPEWLHIDLGSTNASLPTAGATTFPPPGPPFAPETAYAPAPGQIQQTWQLRATLQRI